MKTLTLLTLLSLLTIKSFCQSVEISPQNGTIDLKNTSIKVSGTEKSVFIHEVNPGLYDGGHISIIDNVLCNANYNAMLLVTHYIGYTENFVYNSSPVGVFYDVLLEKWKLINLDFSTIPTGAKFNIMVINK